MGKGRSLTAIYSCVQAPFWMSLCIFSGFCAVYLQSLGYSNAELGIVLACGTLLGSLLGPWLSSAIDRSTEDRITASTVMPPVLAAEAAALIVLMFMSGKGVVTSAAYAMFIGLSTSVNSLNLRLYTDGVYCGYEIDYGIARSMGSIGYVVTSFIAGLLCEHISPRIVPAAGLVICIAQYISFRRYSRYLTEEFPGAGYRADDIKGEENTADAESTGNAAGREALPMWQFLLSNRRFCMILAGTVLMFFAHNTLCNFFINVVRNAGGNTGDMGMLNGLMALFETPVIFFYSRLTHRWKTSSVLRFAFLMFTVKAAALAAAASVGQLAAALLLQAPSFGLYTGGIVVYVNHTISHEDSGKAQSLAFTMTMLSNVFASTISGHLYDTIPVSSVMWIAAAVSLAGSILAVMGVKTTKI